MKSSKNILYLLFIIASVFALSCSGSIFKEAYPTLIDGQYDSEFPYRGCSKQLQEISETIKFVNCITYYKVHIFKEGSKIKKGELTDSLIEKITIQTRQTERTAAGTATIIYSEANKIALLTCSHIITFVDTIYSFENDSLGNYLPYLNAILIKERQDIYIPDLPEGGDLVVLCKDENYDVALLGKEFKKSPTFTVPCFKYPFGKAKELEWGTFVYLFGFPMGTKTLTKALVSSPNRDKNSSFIVDANFNEGFSGGIILAIRDGVPNFELVGMVKTMFADYEYVLKPTDEFNYSKHNPLVPYRGDLFVDKRVNVKYGVSKAIPTENIFDFLYSNRIILSRKGYDLNQILAPYF
ncbi:MAG: serine protease [Ignavibacteriales bacterium]|nr:serine protease [Ignavibacteriales bacterium]